MPTGPLPSRLCPSSEPSPVTTRSAAAIFAPNPVSSAIRSNPGTSRAAANCSSPKPNPPAAPAPGVSAHASPAVTRTSAASARSKTGMVASSAPFCGPKTRVAPVTPSNGLATSQATVTGGSTNRPTPSTPASRSAKTPGQGDSRLPARSNNLTPSAAAMPAPPSFVALPPIPMTMRAAPPTVTAWRIIMPVPNVFALRISRSPGAIRQKPDASAISITATGPSGPSAST